MDFQDGANQGLLDPGLGKEQGQVLNVDKFLTDMYQYYVSKGMGAIVLSELCGVFTLGFTICFSVFLLAFVDWSGLLQCHDEDTCQNVNDALVRDPFHQTPTMFTFFVFTYFVLCGAMWLYKCISAIGVISDAFDMATFYHETLRVQIAELPYMEWYEVVDKLIALHTTGIFRLTTKEELTPHDVALRIMRKDNYMIGLINKKVLELSVPWWLSPFASEQLFLTKSLEWSLSFCILEYMFNDSFDISAEFLHDEAGLQWRFQVVGLIHFLLLPFMLIYMTVHFFLQNAQQFHSSKAYLGPRQWSPLALWEFREFNELPHVFEDRINRSISPANEYIQTFHNPYLTILARCVTYVTGAFIATLLLVSVLSDGALLYVHIAEYNLLWYLGVFSACYAGARSLIPDETKVQESAAVLLKRTCAHTHHFPEAWEQRAHSVEVKNQVCEMFQFKAQIFLMEVLSVVLTPAVLCFSLPLCSSLVLAFVKNHSRYIEGIGAVCDYSLFDFDQYGDEDFGAEKSGFINQTQRPNDGKLEKSFMNFKQHHPNYDGSRAAQMLTSRLQSFKDMKCQQRENMATSAIQKSVVFASHNVAGTANAYDSPEPPSPAPYFRHHQHSMGNTQQQQQQHMRNNFQKQQQQYPGQAERRGEDISSEARQSLQIQIPNSNHASCSSSSDQVTAGAETEAAPFALGLAHPDALNPAAVNASNPAAVPAATTTTSDQPTHVIPPIVDSADINLLSPSEGRLRHSMEGGDEVCSEVGELLSPVAHRNHRIRSDSAFRSAYKGSGVPPPFAFAPSTSVGAGGSQVEMSHLSRMGGVGTFAPRVGSRSMLFDSGMTNQRSALRDQFSRENMPSVLLSILKQENIDYENDFYWMAQFQAERRRDPAGLERSIISASMSPRPRMRRAVSSTGGGSSEILGAMSPIRRQYSDEQLSSPPPFISHDTRTSSAHGSGDGNCGSSGGVYSPGLTASSMTGMEYPRQSSSGTFYATQQHSSNDPNQLHYRQGMGPGPVSGRQGSPEYPPPGPFPLGSGEGPPSPPRFSYGAAAPAAGAGAAAGVTASGSVTGVTGRWGPSNLASTGAASTGAVASSSVGGGPPAVAQSANYRQTQFRPAGTARKSVSNLGSLAESDMEG